MINPEETRREDLILMAPAGSMASLNAAIQAGADAVYFGLGKLNMRARSAHNFDAGDLPEITKRLHRAGRKAYLTLNTVVYNDEEKEVRKLLNHARQNKVDAVIASDMSVITTANELDVPVHLSTQTNIANMGAVRYYARFGSVMVLARELDLEQIRAITKKIEEEGLCGPGGQKLQVELFVHGALCMAVSGKCYLSLHIANHSANRGDCFQICRRSYKITDLETDDEIAVQDKYLMSPRDLCTISFLDQILDAGVKVLKIEGRARSPEYVKTVTTCYNEGIDAWLNGTYTGQKIRTCEEKLRTVFNRGFWGGYYLGKSMGEWSRSYGSQATKKKVYLGKGTNYFSKVGVAEVKLETGSLSVGDEILITGPTTGVVETRIKELRVHDKNVKTAQRGSLCSFPLDETLRRSDKIFKLVLARDRAKKDRSGKSIGMDPGASPGP